MTELSGTPGWFQAVGPERFPSRPRPRQVRRDMPGWLPVAAAAVLVWWPVTFVMGLLGSGIWLLLVSIVLALLAIPALIVLMLRADLERRRPRRSGEAVRVR